MKTILVKRASVSCRMIPLYEIKYGMPWDIFAQIPVGVEVVYDRSIVEALERQGIEYSVYGATRVAG